MAEAYNALKSVLVNSLYRHAQLVQHENGDTLFTLPERIPFIDRDDNTLFIASGREYLWHVAIHHYKTISIYNIDLIDVIAQFQPEPIQDTSVRLKERQEVYIPSLHFIAEVVQGPSLIEEAEL